ncbi:MAG: peptidoglycan-binding domain-containing protein [Pseudomonadota bacterium]
MRWLIYSLFFTLLLASPLRADVAALQTSLKTVGCYDGPVNGKASLALRTAARCFQQHIGAQTDGTLSPEEEQQLFEMAASGAKVTAQEGYVAEQASGDQMPAFDPNASGKDRFSSAQGDGQNTRLATNEELLAGLKDLVAQSQNGEGLAVRASRPFPTSASDIPLILIKVDGVPTLSYSPAFTRSEGWQMGMTVSCAPGLRLDLTFLLTDLSGGEVLTPGARHMVKVRAFGGSEAEFPAEVIETPGTSGRLVRVRSTISASHPFFANLQPTTNLQAQLKENGRFKQFTAAMGLSTFFEDLRPLLDVCSGRVAPETFQLEGDDELERFVSGEFAPTDGDIVTAIRARVSETLARMDNQDVECARARIEEQEALMALCRFGIRPQFTSRSVFWEVASAKITQCVTPDIGDVVCAYEIDSRFNERDVAGLPLAFSWLAKQIATASYGRFNKEDGRWVMTWVYSSCDFTSTSASCNGREL